MGADNCQSEPPVRRRPQPVRTLYLALFPRGYAGTRAYGGGLALKEGWQGCRVVYGCVGLCLACLARLCNSLSGRNVALKRRAGGITQALANSTSENPLVLALGSWTPTTMSPWDIQMTVQMYVQGQRGCPVRSTYILYQRTALRLPPSLF